MPLANKIVSAPCDDIEKVLSVEQLVNIDFVESMHSELSLVAKVMAWYYFFISTLHPFFVVEDKRWFMVMAALATSFGCFYLSRFLRLSKTPSINLLITAQLSLVAVTTFNVLFHMLLTGEVYQTTSIVMVFMLIAYLRLPLAYYCSALFIVAALWASIMKVIAIPDDPLIAHYSFAVLFGAIICSVIRVTQHRLMLKRIAGLHDRLVLEQQLYDANGKLEYQAQHDPLTTIANRRKMSQQLDIIWDKAKKEQRYLSVMFCDVDNFKEFNDKHGHLKGDMLLLNIARIMTENSKDDFDLAARVGGDEFVLLLSNTDMTAARNTASEICRRVRALVVADCTSTITIGSYSLIPHDDIAKTNVLALADQALYQAKGAGRDGFVCNKL
jgi:diguanylate cyclase (GGDEF)-like protein